MGCSAAVWGEANDAAAVSAWLAEACCQALVAQHGRNSSGGSRGSGRPANYWGPAPAQKPVQPQAGGPAQALALPLTWGHSSGTRSGRMQPREGGSPGAMRRERQRVWQGIGRAPAAPLTPGLAAHKCARLPACLPLHTVHNNTPSENMSTACVTWRLPNKSSGACRHRSIGESALDHPSLERRTKCSMHQNKLRWQHPGGALPSRRMGCHSAHCVPRLFTLSHHVCSGGKTREKTCQVTFLFAGRRCVGMAVQPAMSHKPCHCQAASRRTGNSAAGTHSRRFPLGSR